MKNDLQDKKVPEGDCQTEDISRIIAEHKQMQENLRTHQVELEMQNEELRHTQHKLALSQEKYFKLYDLAPVGYVTVDEKGMVVEANLTAVALLGVEHGVLVGKSSLTQFIVPEDQDIYYFFRNKLQETMEPQACELRMKNGAQFWVRMEGVILQCDPKVRECNIIIRDVTKRKQLEEALKAANDELEWHVEKRTEELKAEIIERKRAEETLRERESLFRELMHLAPAGIYLSDIEGNCIFTNPCWNEMAGMSGQEALGKGWINGLHPDDRETVLASWNRMVESDGQWELEYRFQTPEGKITWVRGLATPQRDASGKIIRYVGLNIDITKRKQSEEALRESEERCRTLIDFAVDGILLGSRDGIITYADECICNTFGLKKEDFIGKHIKTLPHTQECLKKSPFRFEMLQEGEIAISERMLIRPDGSEMTLETRTKMMLDGTYQLVCYDITKRVQLEKALIEAERLSAFGELSAGVAHDYNNSLQMIIGYLDMALLNQHINPEVAELIKRSRRGALDAAVRVRQLQSFTKKTSRASFRAMNLNNLLEEAIQQSRPLWKDEAEKKGLQFTFQRHFGKIEMVDGDDAEIRSALHNLIKNAVEAMPAGGMITLETGTFDKKVYIRVTDTGVGMDEDTKKRIFDPFFTTKGFKLGIGLGMSIVHSTIRDHGGRIFVRDTEVGKGTTIEMLLPFRTKKEEVQEKPVSKDCQICVRVLWVDDEVEIRKLGKMFLEKLGHTVDVAASGEEALKLLGTNQYDVLITDIGMPNMSGWQLLNAINGRYPEMKAVVLSGWGSGAFEYEKAAYKIEHVLGKPTTQADLKKLFNEMFSGKV